MSRRPHPWLIALALLALGYAQVFGLMRGYLCDCHGIVSISAFDHCHPDHDQCCHDDETPLHSHTDHDDEDGETHEHEPVKDTVQAQSGTSVAFSISAPLPTFCILPKFSVNVIMDESVALVATLPPRALELDRRWPHVLTHAVALRI